jgi:hypothetical protein
MTSGWRPTNIVGVEIGTARAVSVVLVGVMDAASAALSWLAASDEAEA